jgi:hypothetical protein
MLSVWERADANDTQMMTKTRLVCRDDGCEESETFPSLRVAQDSAWSGVSPYGMKVGQHREEHRAHCSTHGESEDDESPPSRVEHRLAQRWER